MKNQANNYLNYVDLANTINQNSKIIVNEIYEEYLVRYLNLINRYWTINVAKDEKFRKAFSSYYIMRYVTQEYRAEFFKLMEKEKRQEKPNFENLSKKLYKINGIHQFSFITKFLNTRFNDFPIYDRSVSSVFGFKRNATNFEDKIVQDKGIIEHMSKVYRIIEEENMIKPTLDKFNKKFPEYEIPFVKKIDFFVWVIGKMREQE